jgi:hypothetical protein
MISRKPESGASMLEVLMYLSLIVVISVATFKVYQSESNKAERLRLEGQVVELVERIRVFEFGYKGLRPTNFAKLTASGIKLNHKWGNGRDAPNSSNNINNDIMIGGLIGSLGKCLSITVKNLPKDACIHLVTQLKLKGCEASPGNKRRFSINGIASTSSDTSLCNKDDKTNKMEIHTTYD